jgi:phosphatidylserine synthase
MQFLKTNKFLNLPNTISLIGIVLNLVNLFLAIQKESFLIVIFLFNLGIVLDLFDGYFARKLNQVTTLGKYLDTINDIILYLIFPFTFVFSYQITIINIQIIFLYTVLFFCGVYRLLRFVKLGLLQSESKKYYTGLPVYWNLLFINLCIFLGNDFWWFLILYILAISVLMISKLKILKFNPKQSLFWLFVWNIFVIILMYV